MLKYSFYTLSIRKFEREQMEESEESALMKDYWTKKYNLKKDISEEDLVNHIQIKQQEIYDNFSELDEIEEDPEIFGDLISKSNDDKETSKSS